MKTFLLVLFWLWGIIGAAMMKTLLAVVAVCLMLFTPAAAAEPPIVITASVDIPAAKTDGGCVARAFMALEKRNYDTGGGLDNDNIVYGFAGDYSILIRCETANRIAVFIVAGPEYEPALAVMKAYINVWSGRGG